MIISKWSVRNTGKTLTTDECSKSNVLKRKKNS